MTRFARSKGSKASNERIPEPATPWHEMKNQLMGKYKEKEASGKREEADERRTKTYQTFLKEKQEEDAKNVKWAEFPGVEKKAKKKVNDKKRLKGVVKNGFDGRKGKKSKDSDDDDDDDFDDDNDDDEFQSLKRKLEEKLKEEYNENAGSSDDEAPEEVSAKITPKQPVIKKQKAKKEKLTISVDGNAADEESPEEAAKRKAEKKLERRKQQRLKQREALQGKSAEEMTEDDQAKVEKLKQKLLARRQKRLEVKEKKKAEKAAKAGQQPPKQEKPFEELTEEEKARRDRNKQKAQSRKLRQQKLKEKKLLEEGKKIKQQQPKQKKPLEEMTEEERAKVEKHRLKKLAQKEKRDHFRQEKKNAEEAAKKQQKFERSKDGAKSPQRETVRINGQEVQLARFNGFPVRKEDCDRLLALEKEMRIKGVPRNEIKRALKLEQRRAEKALARLKKKACFHCRKSGHNLSECPLLSEQNQHESINSGICFKCGSTEHTHFNCRVVRGDEYKFATCFICKEQGHISRQCPDNSRGLYPQGGACRVCGDVTHLKKDCPRYQAQQEQNTVLAETMGNGNLEGLEEDGRSESPKKKRLNKVIKF